jgi:hypothetical protein
LRGQEATYTELNSPPFHGENRGSIPLGRANEIKRLDESHKSCLQVLANAAARMRIDFGGPG